MVRQVAVRGMARPSRRRFLATAGLGSLSLAGCAAAPFSGDREPDLTVYVGAYHWGFLVVDESGAERERVVLDPGARLRLVAFNTEAHGAIEALPTAVREALPDHEALEERNGDRIPAPPHGDLHDALAEANERYPDHSLAVVPAGANAMPMGGGRGGMMLHPVPLPHDATRPAEAGLAATDRGDFTLSCLTDCGYGHAFMNADGALVVR